MVACSHSRDLATREELGAPAHLRTRFTRRTAGER